MNIISLDYISERVSERVSSGSVPEVLGTSPNVGTSKKLNRDSRKNIKVSPDSAIAIFIEQQQEIGKLSGKSLSAEQILDSLIPKDLDEYLLSVFEDFEKAVKFFMANQSEDIYPKIEAMRVIYSKSIVGHTKYGSSSLDKMSWDSLYDLLFPEGE